ncbi:meprin A, partial [Mytilus galloprovincialis]
MHVECACALILTLVNSLFVVYGQDINDLIESAANSSDEFNFFYDASGENTVIKYELDILAYIDKWSEEQDMMAAGGNSIKKRNALRNTNRRWTSNTIPYEINGYFSSNDRRQITAAMNDYNTYTCLKFRPATYNDRNKIRIQNGGGCSSFVGMQGGAQTVSLASGCRIKRIIIHELGHAAGFHHEQTRPDRDQYISLRLNNVPPSVRYNFQKYTWSLINAYDVPYDYYSVMHYGRKAFSHNGYDTIIPKDSKFLNVIGKSPGFSFSDVKLLNIMYKCG